MPITVVVGGQFGSEGKGKVAHFLAKEQHASIAVRVGGPNSGHTVIDESGQPRIFQHLPTAAILPDIVCVIPAGSYIDREILLSEVASTGLTSDRLLIDPNAVVITDREKCDEENAGLRQNIGSTLSGTGAAVQRRIARDGSVRLAKDEKPLEPFLAPTRSFMREYLSKGERIIIEGTQGFGLSLFHSNDYPHVTSRDTTAAGFVSEAGLSPLDVDQIVLVIRAFPIRVSGDSGPLLFEINWQEITDSSQSPTPIIEYTSVTKSVRRVANFDPRIVRDALMVNSPTHVALNHVDYIDADCLRYSSLTPKAHSFVRAIEETISMEVHYIGISPSALLLNDGFAPQRSCKALMGI